MTYTDFFASVNALYILVGILVIIGYLMLLLYKKDKSDKNSKH